MVRESVIPSNGWVLSDPCDWCGSRHRSWYKAATCRWKKGLIWVMGNPPAGGPCFALVSFCWHTGYTGGHITVTLWETSEEAEESKRGIDRTGCGSACCRNHRIFKGVPT
jgi:hypothetical protein